MSEENFIYLIRPRSGFIDSMTAEEEDVMDRHFAYLQALQAGNSLVLAGPCLDGAFGVVILRAASEAKARVLMENDPAVRAGIMQPELHHFRISLS